MPIPSLPTELLDEIVRFIPEVSGQGDERSSAAALSDLALVSKRFLPLARCELYSRPLAHRQSWSCESFELLITSLKLGGGRLGRLVQSLEGLNRSLTGVMLNAILKRPVDDGSHLRTVFSRLQAVKLPLVEACTDLVELEVTPILGFDLRSFCQSAKHTLTTLRLTDYKCQDAQLDYILSSDSLENMKALKLCNVEVIGANPVNSYPIESLFVQRTTIESTPVLDLRLSNLSRFRTLHVEGYLGSIEPLLTSVSSVIQRLTVSIPTPSEPRARLSGVGLYEHLKTFRSVISPRSCETLPKLTSFAIHKFRGPLLEFLAALSTTSQSLSSIDLSESQWLQSDEEARRSRFIPITAFRGLCFSDAAQIRLPSFPVEDVEKVLERFTKLERIDFGIVPGGGAFDSLVSKLEMRGIRVGWRYE